jgi:hypothetical protein
MAETSKGFRHQKNENMARFFERLSAPSLF